MRQKKAHVQNFEDMLDLAYRNIFPVVYYSPGNDLTGRIFWPSKNNEFPKRLVMKDGDSLQHGYLYMSRW